MLTVRYVSIGSEGVMHSILRALSASSDPVLDISEIREDASSSLCLTDLQLHRDTHSVRGLVIDQAPL
jgi:hypothetical protein